MVPSPKKTVEHFTHPNHQLLEINDDNEYLCDGCKTYGIGNRFRCHGCNFDLHEYCSTCPMSLSSFMHPLHQLHIVRRQPQAARQNDRFCDVCGDSVEGLFYRCKICEFDVHPLCTQLPQQVKHILHPEHPLTLKQFPLSWCLVCKNDCTSWSYSCGICGVGIHLECLLTAFDASKSASTLTSTSTSTSTPWPVQLTSTSTSALTPTPTPPPPPVQRSVWQPSSPTAASPPAFGIYVYQMLPFGNPYAYGVQAPPAFGAFGYQIPPFGSAYASGVQAPPAFGTYGHQIPPFGSAYTSGVQAPPAFGAYGIQIPPFGSAYTSGVQAPPAFGAYGYQIPLFGSAYASGVQAPPVGAYNNQYGMPIVYRPGNMSHNQHPSGNQQVGGGGFQKRIDRISGGPSSWSSF